jgi:hypothetical protein
LAKFDPGPDGHLTLAVDDSPTKRYGKCVEGAGVHRNPTPGPADGDWVYGHNWVSLCLLARHASWGVIALPLRSLLYVRAIGVPKLADKYDWKFKTKHELAMELTTWVVGHARSMGLKCPIWLAADGAYATSKMVKPLTKLGVTLFSRLRKDAKLFDLPPARDPKQRGRPPIYGKNQLSLAKRAGQPDGWSFVTHRSRGQEVTTKCKSFEATSQIAGGVVRVVIVSFPDGGWAPYFCTDPRIAVADILETVDSRWAIEEHFHDVKEVWGAGQQQVRNVWSSVACWNLNQWMYTMVELCSWDLSAERIVDRADRPWDNPNRRPSHADRRRAIVKEMLGKQFCTLLPVEQMTDKIRRLIADVISLCA